jgi:hypothetical protein
MKREQRVRHRVFYLPSLQGLLFFFSSSEEPRAVPKLWKTTRHGIMESPHNGYLDWLHPGACLSILQKLTISRETVPIDPSYPRQAEVAKRGKRRLSNEETEPRLRLGSE